MAQPSIIVYSASDVDNVPMLPDDQTFSGANTFSGAVVLSGALSGTSVKDEDSMVSNSATAVATQQSIKAYSDNYMTGIVVVGGNVLTYNGQVVWLV